MDFRELTIAGAYEITLFHATDARGTFVKSFHRETFERHGLQSDFAESFHSVNRQNVIRGMHFQRPPHDHAKLVYVTAGSILDVVLDLRKHSPSFGKYEAVNIRSDNYKAVYLPVGVAHGFCCLTEATMVYLTSTVHVPASDDGVRWDSFGMEWPVKQPVLSERDKSFKPLNELNTPF